ncbi:caspase-2-like [Lingula anatina]|nr:caspase-2-like [Lingula anatina]|eukprot:XP_023933711.1 caspase-2-like [Lingula anatina]
MSKMNIEALKKNRPDLVKGITAPCLKNALRRFKARDIYTEDEISAIEGVAVIYDRVGAFLDVLKRKEQRAFYHFCQVLIENRASHLADLIKS